MTGLFELWVGLRARLGQGMWNSGTGFELSWDGVRARLGQGIWNSGTVHLGIWDDVFGNRPFSTYFSVLGQHVGLVPISLSIVRMIPRLKFTK